MLREKGKDEVEHHHPVVHHEETPTEELINVNLTVPHHIDGKGTMVEDKAGTGEPESLGG